MYIVIERSHIFHALQCILGFIGSIKSSLPILEHVLLQVRNGDLFIIGTDIDMEIVVNIPIYKIYKAGQVTAPARKLFDICRTSSVRSKITLQCKDDKLFIDFENSYFSLVTFSALTFPSMSHWDSEVEISISQDILKKLIESTYFSMAKQDVRYYLNGMLFEFDMEKICTVTTDGHRLSFSSVSIFSKKVNMKTSCSIIVPRKYIMNIVRILNIQNKQQQDVKLRIGGENISIVVNNRILTSKLINGVFPNYRSVFPKSPIISLEADSKTLWKAVKRSVILCNEKLHIIKFLLTINQLKIISENSMHEISEQVVDVIYSGHNMEIGFNVYYMLDVLNVIQTEKIQFFLTDENSSIQILSNPKGMSTYIIMPIRL